MNARNNCPSAEVLGQYLRGQLPEDNAEHIELHLENCALCLEALGRAAETDPLYSTVRDIEIHQGRLQLSEQHLANLKDKVQALWPRSPILPEAPDKKPGTTGFPFDVRQILDEPRGSDELGWLDHYQVLKVLGRGGMGVVFLAHDERLRREVAIKVMLPNGPAGSRAKARFLQEARSLAQVANDHVVAIMHVGGDEDNPYIVMPLLSGQSLEDRIQNGPPLTLAKILQIGHQAALGLAAVHAKGLIHRDIKPSNLWLEVQSQDNIKLLDFGLALENERPNRESEPLTEPGMVLGTRNFMSPEQAQGYQVEFATDIYSLGVVLYRLITGRFPGADAGIMLQELLDQDVPRHAAALIVRMLDHNAARRPTAREVADDMLCYDETKTFPIRSSQPKSRKYRRALLGGAVLVLVVALLSLGLFLSSNQTEPVFKGHFDLAVMFRDGKDVVGKKEKFLGDPGYLCVKQGDQGRLEMKLTQGPAAYFYVLKIEPGGNAVPLYPDGWTWAAPPSTVQDKKNSDARWPAMGAMPLGNSKTGLAAFLWLVRATPLTPAEHDRLKTIFTAELQWRQPENLEDGIYLFENAKLTTERIGLVSAHPVRQTEAALQKIHNQQLAAYTRAVCYPSRNP